MSKPESAPTAASPFAKFAFEEEFAGQQLTPQQQRDQAHAAGVTAGEQKAQAAARQQLQQEIAQRDTTLAQAIADLAQARLDYQAGLQAHTLELMRQLLAQLFGTVQQKWCADLLAEHLPTLLEQADSATGGTLLVAADSVDALKKAIPAKSKYVVEAAPQLASGQILLQWPQGEAQLDLPALHQQLQDVLTDGKVLAKQTANSAKTAAKTDNKES